MKIAVVLFDGFELLDVFGPLEMFGQLPDWKIVMVADKPGPVASTQGPCAWAEESLETFVCCDVLMVPGGKGTRTLIDNPDFIRWLKRAALGTEYLISVCTGSALLAKAGLLDSKQATSNRLAFDWVTTQGPKTLWQSDQRWVQDDKVFTSAGVSAGMDMSLAFIAHLYGQEKAQKIADYCEYHWLADPTEIDCQSPSPGSSD
ncbi:DJ-1/PfpI family protein [Bowmanella yangjiangensis]|uniref:DJ-1/PfpI family protein n=1 Tax=Bowmanella yangjiangensis TaxID=2811230 RepID=A0ABS3CS81_9ALTE|nr:DJ-1/PfpI family protein [Bowmanella yangjiangensis]MBN7818514.1 DJ-1/PfpI family protein [Bowmanella yangjiangensis]